MNPRKTNTPAGSTFSIKQNKIKTDSTGVPAGGIGRHHLEKVTGTIVENARGEQSVCMAWIAKLKNNKLKNKGQA